ncbi:hypothetical protein ABZY03_17165 [Streptomyces klenkii]|uniref:hypothetical protein n=1 Tax=Streptomyces klenkii TaxID=1420899 RepID=UPI0033A5911E
MSTVRRFAAAIATTALLAVGSVALAAPAQAADGGLDDVLGILPSVFGVLNGIIGGLGG